LILMFYFYSQRYKYFMSQYQDDSDDISRGSLFNNMRNY
jgi:hypothetical protein